MKKIIRPISVLRIMWLLVWLILIGISVGTVILIILENELDIFSWLSVIFALPIFIFSLLVLCFDFNKSVKFTESSLIVSADFADKRGIIVRRLQYGVKVRFDEIKNISLIYSKNDSNNVPVKHVFVSMPYILIHSKDGKTSAINVYFYNKKQRIQLVDNIKSAVEKSGTILCDKSGKDMWSEVYSNVK